jgi:hypothetical protein
MVDKKTGHYAFLVAVVLAVLAALIPALQVDWVVWALIILGLIVGFLNITAKETTEFLVATIALMLVGSAGLEVIPTAGAIIGTVLMNILAIAVPAALIVSLKAIYTLAQE